MTVTTDHALKSIEKVVPTTISLGDNLNLDAVVNSDESPNFKGWYLANTLDSICRANTDPFMPIFARSIGASASQIGFLSGIYTLINISQLLWARLSTKVKKNRIFIVLGWLVSAIFFIPIALLKSGQTIILIILRFLQGLVTSAAIPAQASLMADHISHSERAKKVNHFTELRLIGVLIGSLTSGFLFTLLVDNLQLSTRIAFLVLFLWTMILSIIASLLIFMNVPDHPYIKRVEPSILIEKHILDSNSSSKKPLKAKYTLYLTKFSNFWLFCFFAVIFYFGVYIAAPFFIILEIENYHFSFFAASILTSVQITAQILLTLLIAKYELLDKFGRKPALIIGLIFISVSSILIIIPYYFPVPIFLWSLFAWICLGIGWGLFQTALAVFLLDLIHPRYKTTLVAAFNALTGVAMFLGPVIGGIITEFFQNISLVFLLRGIIVILTLIFLLKVREPVIPGIAFHPIRPYVMKFFRVNASKGAELEVIAAKPRILQYKHWFFLERKQRSKKK